MFKHPPIPKRRVTTAVTTRRTPQQRQYPIGLPAGFLPCPPVTGACHRAAARGSLPPVPSLNLFLPPLEPMTSPSSLSAALPMALAAALSLPSVPFLRPFEGCTAPSADRLSGSAYHSQGSINSSRWDSWAGEVVPASARLCGQRGYFWGRTPQRRHVIAHSTSTSKNKSTKHNYYHQILHPESTHPPHAFSISGGKPTQLQTQCANKTPIPPP